MNVLMNSVADPLDEPMEVDSGICPPSGLVQQLPSGGAPNVSQSAPSGLVQQLPSGSASDVSQSTPLGLVQHCLHGVLQMYHNQNCDLCSWKCFREEPHSHEQ